MKRIMLAFMAFACTAGSMKAKVFRVNNVDSNAPYSSIIAAVRAAEEGDTIMVDGSAKEYENTILTKRVVLIGPGYLLKENGIANESDQEALVDGIEVQKEGTIIKGMHIGGWHSLEIKAPKVVVSRCYIGSWEGILLHEGADNCIFHQNFMADGVGCKADTYYHQFTNNICHGGFGNICHSYIYYNTFCNDDPTLHNARGNKIEWNIVHSNNLGKEDKDNTYANNLALDEKDLYQDVKTDLDIINRTKQLPTRVVSTYGASAGTAPYVVSGIPASPVIERIDVPASTEQGSKMSVTIKLGQGQ